MADVASGIAHHAWPGGLAVSVTGPGGPLTASFGPGGWTSGGVLEEAAGGPPGEVQVTTLVLPAWLTGQLPSLRFITGALHTDFVRLERLLHRLQSRREEAVVVILGPRPLAAVVQDGVLAPVDPPHGASSGRVEPSAASGWIVVFSGRVALPATAATAPEPEAPRLPEAPPQARPPAPPGEVFISAPGVERALPADLAAEIEALAGPAGLMVPGLLDGARSIEEVARTAGLTAEQAAEIVRRLVVGRLAFRHVRRTRPAPSAPAPSAPARGQESPPEDQV